MTQTAVTARPKSKYTNRTKVLLCYVLAFGAALVLPQVALRLVYPYKLVGSAPAALSQLTQTLPALSPLLAPLTDSTRLADGMTVAQRAQALQTTEAQWLALVSACLLLGWLITLALQLWWRAAYRHPRFVAETCARAIRAYHRRMLLILLCNLLCAFPVFWFGVRYVAGVTLWDVLAYFGGYALHIAAAFVCFRWAAPPAISGRHSFFKRL